MKRPFYKQITEAMEQVGIESGDLIFTQSSLVPFLVGLSKQKQHDFLDDFCEAVFDKLGPNGTVGFPTYSYSFFENKIYDPTQPPTSAMGLLPAAMWRKRICLRTSDPMFSVGIIGRLGEFLSKDLPKTCFGKGSFYDRFYQLNGKLLQIGVSVDGTTFVLYFDQKMKNNYRYAKKFTGHVKRQGEVHKEVWTAYVRRLDGSVQTDLRNFKARVEQDGYVRKAKLLDGYIYSLPIKTLYKASRIYLRENPRFFLNQ